jgi:hypothetical protein
MYELEMQGLYLFLFSSAIPKKGTLISSHEPCNIK